MNDEDPAPITWADAARLLATATDPTDTLASLRQMFPEQMRRDPTGALARATLRACEAASGTAPELVVRHAHRRCGAPLAAAGHTPHGPLVTSFQQGYQPGEALTDALVRTAGTLTWAPPDAQPTATGSGLRFPAGTATLLAEPPGFPAAPTDIALRCPTHGTVQAIPVAVIVKALRRGQRSIAWPTSS